MWWGSRPDSTRTVQADAGVVGDGLQDVTHHRASEVAPDEVVDECLGLALVHQEGTPGDVDDRMGQGLVQRDSGLTEATDAALVTQRDTQGLADTDSGVLHGVGARRSRVSPVARTVKSMREWLAPER